MDSFYFILPILMAVFATCVLAIASPTERWLTWCGLGYALMTAGFAIPPLTDGLPMPVRGSASTIAFTLGTLMFGQIIGARAGQRRIGRWHIVLAAGIIGHSLVTRLVLHDVAADLIVNDLGGAALLALPLIRHRRRWRHPADRLLIGLFAIFVVERALRGLSVPFTFPGAHVPFRDSAYGLLVLVAAPVHGLLFGIATLVTTLRDRTALLTREAADDPLTGLLNRRGFEAAVAPADGGCIVLCDIDHFKRVNDRHGHAVGDQVIRALAGMLRAPLPPGGVVARFGGEEFVAWLPASAAAHAASYANRVRTSFRDLDWSGTGMAAPVSASFGIAAVQSGDRDLDTTIARADQALYDAKRHGRDRVMVKLTVVGDGIAA